MNIVFGRFIKILGLIFICVGPFLTYWGNLTIKKIETDRQKKEFNDKFKNTAGEQEELKKKLQDVNERIKDFSLSLSKICLSKPQSIRPLIFTKIKFNKKVFDTLNQFNRQSHRWTASVSGLYRIYLNIITEKLSDKAEILVAVYKNGAMTSLVARENLSGDNRGKLTLIDMIKVAVGDYIEIYIYHNYKKNILLSSEFGSTYLLIEK